MKTTKAEQKRLLTEKIFRQKMAEADKKARQAREYATAKRAKNRAEAELKRIAKPPSIVMAYRQRHNAGTTWSL